MTNTPVLEIGTSKIVCALRAQDDARNMPAMASVEYEGIKNGEFADKERAVNSIISAIEQAEYESARRVDALVCGVPACFLLRETKEYSVPVSGDYIKGTDVDALKRELLPEHFADALHIDTKIAYYMDDDGEVYVDEPLRIRSEKLTALVVFSYVSRDFTEVVEKALGELKIDVIGYVPEDLAQAMHFIPGAERDKSAVLIDIGASETAVSAVYAEAILKHETCFMGSLDVTGDLAIALDTDMNTAWKVRKNFVFGIDDDGDEGRNVYGKDDAGHLRSFPADVASDAIIKRYRMILSEVKGILEKMSDVLTPESRFFLTGMDSDIRGITQFLTVELGTRVQTVWNSEDMLGAEYNTSLSLLDNKAYTIYDLNRGKTKKKSVLSRLFHK